MKKLTKSLTVPVFITCTLGWAVFVSHAIEENNKDGTKDSSDIIKRIEDIKKKSIAYQIDSSFNNIQMEYERLKEEERKRLEELERQRLEKLEKERQAKLEQERLAEAKRIEEAKKTERARVAKAEERKKQQVVSKGSNENTSSNWMTFNATYYGNDCNGCGNYTYTGIDVSNTIYYKGYRIIASDKNILPMGTLVEIKTPNESFKGVIADIGGGIRGKRLDILVPSESVAANIGRHDVQVRVFGKININ